MCTLLLAWHVANDAPIILAANRDELRERVSQTPRVLVHDPVIYGGRDLLAGGTWLAVDPKLGRIAAVTNRVDSETRGGRDNAKLSRGELPIAVLLCPDADASQMMEALNSGDYNPVNLLYVSEKQALWLSLEKSGAHIQSLSPGFHVMTVGDVDGTSLPKDVRIQATLLAALHDAQSSSHILGAFQDVLRDHSPQGAVCIHGGAYGTVSSSIVVVANDGSVAYRHTQGFPCESDWTKVDINETPVNL